MESTRLGSGIAYVLLFAVQREVQEGLLAPLLTRITTKTEQMSALWPSGRQLTPKVRALVDHLVLEFAHMGMDQMTQ